MIGGVTLMVLGVWVIAQVTAGDALSRLGLFSGSSPASLDSSSSGPATSFGPGYASGATGSTL